MSAITIEEARTKLATWMLADDAVAKGQEYTIGDLELTRADAVQIRKNIEYWKKMVEDLEKRTRGPRLVRVVPLDV